MRVLERDGESEKERERERERDPKKRYDVIIYKSERERGRERKSDALDCRLVFPSCK